MEPIVVKALATLVKSVAAPVLRWFKPLSAEKSAAVAPEKLKTIDQSVFDGVLRRLAAADPNDSIFLHMYDAATNQCFTPDFLRTPNVQDWLKKPSVRADLHVVASAKLFGSPAPQAALAGLESQYGEVAYANSQESALVVAAISAMLVAGVNGRVQDTGTAALVVASGRESTRNFEGVNTKLDNLLASGTPGPLAAVALMPPDAPTTDVWHDAFSVASRGLLHWATTLDDGEHIVRPELDQLLEITQSSKGGTIALLGVPGSGKSALLARLGAAFATRSRVAVLAIKGDLLDASVATEEDLQRDLLLPALPSTMLRRLALVGPVVLLIDQLDALAGHLDTKTGRLSVLLNLVKTVYEVDGLHVFVSCRTFEFTHDIRLSHIDAECVRLELPSWKQVLTILEARGVKAGGWNSDAREVVRVPQQLNTFLLLRAAGVDEPVSNYTAMLDSLWNVRVLHTPRGAQAAQLAFDIAEQMANKEMLWLASARFDDRIEGIKFLVAAGILTTSEHGAVGFSHQTVFEHVLARSFAKNDGQLSNYVLARTESLFVRPKLWAALAYLRGVEPLTYEAELVAIWNAQGLRKHLRFLLIEFMGSQPNPTDKEELLLVAASDQAELCAIVLKAISGSQGWFERFGCNVIAQAMSDEKTADLCIQLLIGAWPHSSEQVSLLLRDVWFPAPSNDRRTLFVLQEASVWTPALVNLAKIIVHRIEPSALHVDSFISVTGGTEPRIAIELLQIILDGELSRLKTEGLRLKGLAEQERPTDEEANLVWHLEHNPRRPLDSFLGDSHHWVCVPELAAVSPSHFVSVLWPWYVSAFRELLDLSGADESIFDFPLRYCADFRFEGEGGNKLTPSSILEAIVVAVEQLAETAPQQLRQWADEQASVELAPVQRLVAHALAHNPAQTSTDALNFLLADERRFFLGSTSNSSSTTLSLIAKCAPYWSSDEVGRFTTRVRAFSPQRPLVSDAGPDAIRWWHRFVKNSRTNLLRTLPKQARTQEIQRVIDEADRARPHRSEPEYIASGWIGPPMDESQMSNASNHDIVNAFKEVPDQSGWDHPKRLGLGGNVQLARAFSEFAKIHPARALEVIHLLQPDFGQRAVGYALETLAERHDPEGLMTLVVQLHERGFGDAEFRTSVARAIDRLLRRGVIINESVLLVLEGWLPFLAKVQDLQDSTNDQNNDQNNDGTESDINDSAFLLSGDARVDFVPGSDYPILCAIVDARLARKEVPALIQLLRRYLSISQNKDIWEHLMRSMIPIPSMDTVNGPVFIGEVLSLPQFDGSLGAAVLMGKTHHAALKEVKANLGRWRDSENLAARIGYGELVALIALTNAQDHQARLWLDELICTPHLTDARVGATRTVVQILWIETQFRADATDVLVRMLKENEVAIWQQIFRVFGLVDQLTPEPHTLRLLQAISDNIEHAPPPSEPYVVERLGDLLPRHAVLVARIATQLIQLWRDRLTNVGSALVFAGREIMDLAITLHRTEGTKLEGLQMFEQLIEMDAYQAREVLNELDHRVKLGANPLRPRLPRRVRRRAA